MVSNNVLYTLNKEEWAFTISEIKRIVKPDGIVVISNLNNKFRAINMYRDHIRSSIKLKGLKNTMISLAKLSYPTIQMFRYNKIISRNNGKGLYSFLVNDEQVTVFERQGLIKAKDTQKVHAKQANLDVFKIRKTRNIMARYAKFERMNKKTVTNKSNNRIYPFIAYPNSLLSNNTLLSAICIILQYS